MVLNFCLQGVFSFLITDSISHLLVSLFKSCISSLVGCYVSRNLSLSSRLSSLLAYDYLEYSLIFFVSLQSSFICYFVYLSPLSFLLGEPSQKFVDFVYIFKSTVLGFIDFLLLSLNIYFVYFLSDLY